jgi:heme/copper-type cytochrome/quinol oxidase subunit 1
MLSQAHHNANLTRVPTSGRLLDVDASVFYEIMTLHGAGMVTTALIAAIGGLIGVLNGTTLVSTRWGEWDLYLPRIVDSATRAG